MGRNNILHLVLKKQWYDLIESGIKKEEYREIKPYWIRRLCLTRKDNPYVYCITENCCQECLANASDDWMVYPFDVVCFHLGYTSTTMLFKCTSITIDKGNPEWGAEKDKQYFVIKLGDRLS